MTDPPIDEDLQLRLSRYFMNSSPVGNPRDIPYWARARSVLRSLGLNDASRERSSQVERLVAELKIGEANAEKLIAAFAAFVGEDDVNAAEELGGICEKHVANGKVTDAISLASDMENLEMQRDERRSALYKRFVDAQDVETAAALENRINDPQRLGGLRYFKIDYVGLASEFPEILEEKFAGICSTDISKRRRGSTDR